MAKAHSQLRKIFPPKKDAQISEQIPSSAIPRIIVDDYVKGTKEIWGEDPSDEFNRRILAVNNMYGWLYQQGILKEVCFEMKDYSNITYFAFDAKDLQKYRDAMEKSDVQDAALAVHHIFEKEYTPCIYSGAIELGWTMRAYRDFDGTVSRSWECDLVKHLDSPSVLDIEEIRKRDGIQAAIHSVFELSGFEPSDIAKDGARLTVKPLSEKYYRSVEKLDEASGNCVADMLDYDDEVDNFAYAWGLFKNNRLIGYCTIGGADDCGGTIAACPGYAGVDSLLLSDVFVMPRQRGQGCGAFLVNEAIKLRTKDDKQLVFLTLLDDNLSYFYKKIGFSSIGDGNMVRDERDIHDIKRDEVFEKAFLYFSSIDLNMADKREYLYDHADKLIYCYENDEDLDLMDVDCWSRFEYLLGKDLSFEDYLVLNEYMDSAPNGITDPHDIEDTDCVTIGNLNALLNEAKKLDAMIESAAERSGTDPSGKQPVEQKTFENNERY